MKSQVKSQQLVNRQAAENLLVEEHVSFCVLDAGLRHLGHTLVIKFIPQIVHVVPAVRYVVATWDQREQRASDLCSKPNKYMEIFFLFSPNERANECGALGFAKTRQMGQLTAGSAVVTDDWQQVVVGGLGGTVFGEEGLQVQALQREGDVGADLGGEHQLVSKSLQVDAEDLRRKTTEVVRGGWGFLCHMLSQH